MTGVRRRGRVTLADVAERARVSRTTASFVLSGRTDMRISTTTADQVLESARVLGYARTQPGTSRKHLDAIGLVSDKVASEPFAGELLRGCLDAANERQCGLVMVESDGTKDLERSIVDDLVDRGIERFVYTTLSTRRAQVPRPLRRRPTVLLNCLDHRSARPGIIPDEQGGGLQAVQCLLEAGHTDGIWLVGEVRAGPYAAVERDAGIRAGLERAGLELGRHVACRWWPPESHEAVALALATGPPPTAVIAMNDRVALGVYQAAAEAGLSVPGDVSVVSFDNSDLAWWLRPGLTSVGLPYFDMGRRAVQVLLDGAQPVLTEELTMPLHERESVAAPRTG